MVRTLALLAMGLVCAQRSLALDPTSRISQYGHSVWRVQEGFFGARPSSITQTTDGYMWVGTEDGLFKFDGIRFVRWSAQPGEALPSDNITRLLGARDGSLWIGTRAGLAHLVRNQLTTYQKDESWEIYSLVEDGSGKIWTASARPGDITTPLCQVLETTMRCYGREDGIGAGFQGAFTQDPSGDLWIAGSTTVTRWRPGSSQMYRPTSLQGVPAIGTITGQSVTTDGSLWVGANLFARGATLLHMVNGTFTTFNAPKWNADALALTILSSDQLNDLWLGTDKGIYRIRETDVDHYGVTEGLSGDFIQTIFQDREGNLWVATSQGLDMFRDLRVKSISTREGLSEDSVDSVAASRDGRVWIGTDRLQVLGPHGISSSPGETFPGAQVAAVFEDHEGRVWAGTEHKLFAYAQGKFREIKRQDGSALGIPAAITEDSEHTIWAEIGGRGALVRIRDMHVQQEYLEPQVPQARRLVADPQKGIWLGRLNGDLARFRDGQVSTFSFGAHPKSRVLAITAGSDGSILGGTAFGVVAWKNGKQQILTMQNGLPCNTVTALLSDDAGNLWLYAQCGLIQIPKEQMQRWWEHPESKLSMRVFDNTDGVQPGMGHFSSGARTPDGRLWFANGNVLQVIDPAHIPQNTLPPVVEISDLVADHKDYPLESLIRLPPLTRNLDIDYTALSYVAPRKVLFRYMLEGHDTAWQQPGGRRQAFYNDLGPGRYRFHVIASNNDGVWNEAGASINFSVLPAYYQTTWFRAACAAAILLLFSVIFRLRVGRLRRQLAIGEDARVNERTRIARDLHDTLLQTLHGLMFQFQAVRNLLPRRPEEAMQSLDDAINETEKALAESRDAIQDLRSEPTGSATLREFLKTATKELANPELAAHELPVFDLIEEGEQRTLSPTVNNETRRIVLELLRNAYRHSHATRIEAEIRYDDALLRIRIRDNGKGIDPKMLKEGGIAGHWGLRGMRERAERIGATLDFWSEAGAGTEVQLTVPGSIAYEISHHGT